MAQKTWVAGDVVTAADTNLYLSGEGGAWSTWTPTVTQSGSVTVTVNTATYGRWGRMIICRMQVTVTGSGTGANAIVVGGLPATSVVSVGAFGQGYLFDTSVPNTFPFIVTLASSTTINLSSSSANAASLALGATSFTAGLASGDIINCSFTYEAAS
jgi:hypothetical protein